MNGSNRPAKAPINLRFAEIPFRISVGAAGLFEVFS